MTRRCEGCNTELPAQVTGRRRKWCTERCRRIHLYAGTCESCGGLTDGSNGRAAAPKLCNGCNLARQHAERRWTPETIVAAIQRWADEHGGVPPVSTDWNATLAEAKGAPPRCADDYPGVPTVQREMGSWSAAITAAGFDAFKVGQYGREGEYAEVIAETIALYRSGLSCEAVGERMGVSGGAIQHRLMVAGEPRRGKHDWREQVAA